MKKMLVVAFVMAAAFAGCSKKKADTTPTSPTTETTDGAATGGATYGGETTPAADPCAGATTDPCAGN